MIMSYWLINYWAVSRRLWDRLFTSSGKSLSGCDSRLRSTARVTLHRPIASRLHWGACSHWLLTPPPHWYRIRHLLTGTSMPSTTCLHVSVSSLSSCFALFKLFKLVDLPLKLFHGKFFIGSFCLNIEVVLNFSPTCKIATTQLLWGID